MPESVLEHGHQSGGRSGLGVGQLVARGERAGERLLADGVLASSEDGDHLLDVDARRCADVDDVDVVAADDLLEGADRTPDALGDGRGRVGIEIGDGDDIEAFLQAPVGPDVCLPDAEADHRRPIGPAGPACRHHPGDRTGRAVATSR